MGNKGSGNRKKAAVSAEGFGQRLNGERVDSDGGDGANFVTRHADNIARGVNRNRVKGGGKAFGLWADRHTGTTFQTGIPVNLEGHRGAFGHQLYLSIFRIGMEIPRQCRKQPFVLHVALGFAED